MAGKINIEAGEFLFREGESANYAYILDEGEIEIVKNGPDGVIKLSEITKGTIFGEMALLDGAPRSAGARATKKTSLTEVDGDTFLNYIRTNPKGALNIMQRLSGQLRQANKNLIDTNTLRTLLVSEKRIIPRPLGKACFRSVFQFIKSWAAI